MRGHGCDVRLGANVEEVLRGSGGSLRGLRLAPAPRAERPERAELTGEVPCDLLVSAIGVVPNTEFLRESGLALAPGGAIEVDERLRTNLPGVWAAGDCANVTWADGSRRPEQLWYTARDQGRAAAASMLDDEVAYRRGTWYNSAKFFDLEYTTAGWVPVLLNWDNTPLDPGPGIRNWFQRAPVGFESQRVVCKGERVVGFNMLGGRWNHEVLLAWIDERRELEWVLSRLGQAQFDEELTPRWQRLPSAELSS
jgi:NADPH-dependent 2,4-dienoyl-CoA reductase/sulfur reductase-like enzyme